MRKVPFAAAATTAALGLAMLSSAAQAQITLKLHHLLGPKAPAHTKMLVPWAQDVEKASGGKVKIEIYPAMSLGGKPPELINQVRDGVVDIVWTVNGYTPGLFPRSGSFEPLRYLPKGKIVVLGLVTTKLGDLEPKDMIEHRIEEAAKIVPLDQLCLSPQCGFSSTVHGNELMQEQQAAKMRLVIDIAREVWGAV